MPFELRNRRLPNVGKKHHLQRSSPRKGGGGKLPLLHDRTEHRDGHRPDPRLDKITEFVKPNRTIPTTMEFIDIADWSKAQQDEG